MFTYSTHTTSSRQVDSIFRILGTRIIAVCCCIIVVVIDEQVTVRLVPNETAITTLRGYELVLKVLCFLSIQYRRGQIVKSHPSSKFSLPERLACEHQQSGRGQQCARSALSQSSIR